MLEARLSEAGLLKRIVDALRDLVVDCTFEFTDEGLKMQAMDSSHVSLCALSIERGSFDFYRCDRATPIGLSLPALSKILKCARDDDTLTLKAGETKDVLTLMFENKAQDKIMDFNIKLMEIDEETLGIPDQKYACKVNMSSAEFAKVIRDLAVLGDTCGISCTKEGVKFSVDGDVGSANVTLRRSDGSMEVIDDDDEGSGSSKGKTGSGPREKGTEVVIDEPVALTFALRYLKLFAQATPLSNRVSFSMAADIPLLIEFPMAKEDKDVGRVSLGKMQFYLAPKIDDDQPTPAN